MTNKLISQFNDSIKKAIENGIYEINDVQIVRGRNIGLLISEEMIEPNTAYTVTKEYGTIILKQMSFLL